VKLAQHIRDVAAAEVAEAAAAVFGG